jgi:DNA-binding IclR family transcriptional regulator
MTGNNTSMLSKGLAIIDLLATVPEPMTTRDISRATGIPKSTVHRLMIDLCASGTVDAEPAGYRLGLHLFELGGAALRQNRVEEIARPILEDLFEATQHLVQIGTLYGTDVIYLARVGQQGRQHVASPVAGRVPANCTAMGKALLAHNPVALETAIRNGLTRKTPSSITDPEVLRNQMREIRRDGYAIELEEIRVGLSCVASPVLVGRRVPIALSLTGAIDSFDPYAFVSMVRSAARQIANVVA